MVELVCKRGLGLSTRAPAVANRKRRLRLCVHSNQAEGEVAVLPDQDVFTMPAGLAVPGGQAHAQAEKGIRGQAYRRGEDSSVEPILDEAPDADFILARNMRTWLRFGSTRLRISRLPTKASSRCRAWERTCLPPHVVDARSGWRWLTPRCGGRLAVVP